jgi:hypothetical protein
MERGATRRVSFAIASLRAGCDFDCRLTMCLLDCTDGAKHQ